MHHHQHLRACLSLPHVHDDRVLGVPRARDLESLEQPVLAARLVRVRVRVSVRVRVRVRVRVSVRVRVRVRGEGKGEGEGEG
jgi:hypothetical protein